MLTSDKRLFIAAAPQKDGTVKELCLIPAWPTATA